MSPLPITILGGFLGAGKTTLVNHLLRSANGVRLAVLVNEFGALPIDADLIEAQSDDLISIAGGCVCCSYGNDMTRALIDLARMDPRPDHIVLEASGVAIPGAIAGAVSLLTQYRCDGIVVLADAETLRATAADRYMGDTITRQLAEADLVILNKGDLVASDALADARALVAGLAPGARIIDTVHARTDPALVLGSFVVRPRDGARASHATPVQSRLLVPAATDPETLARALAAPDLGLIRAKGFVTGPDGATCLVQVVGRRWDVSVADPGPASGIVCLGLPGTDWARLDRLGAGTPNGLAPAISL